jgi:hypothetical protein
MLTHRFRELIPKYLDSPLMTVFSVLTVITTLWGVVSVYKDLAVWGGSKVGVDCTP